jgi:hypothetical protein
VAQDFVRRNIIKNQTPFSNVVEERRHVDPGGHDFFSNNANRALALLSCFPSKASVAKMLVDGFLPFTPKDFVKRHADENAWNANVATALGKSHLLTGEEEFLRRYFTILDELKKERLKEFICPSSFREVSYKRIMGYRLLCICVLLCHGLMQ